MGEHSTYAVFDCAIEIVLIEIFQYIVYVHCTRSIIYLTV